MLYLNTVERSGKLLNTYNFALFLESLGCGAVGVLVSTVALKGTIHSQMNGGQLNWTF